MVPELFPTIPKLRLRLGALERSGYLARPAQRFIVTPSEEYVLPTDRRRRGRPEDVWALAARGARHLHFDGDWNRNNGRLRSSAFAHPLMVTRVLVTLETAARRGLVEIETWRGESQWKTTVTVGGTTLPIVPDGTCRLADVKSNRETQFFLEVDNGTAPSTRTTFLQSSYLKKATAYLGFWRQQMQPAHEPLIILTITKTAARAESLRRTAAVTDPQGRAGNLFWFTSEDQWSPSSPQSFLYEPIWMTAAGERRTLFAA